MTSFTGHRAVYVVGVGMHPFQFPSDTPYVQLGLRAVREALADADLAFDQIESAYVGTGAIGMAAGRVMLRHLGSTGLAVTQVENASASGSSAFRMACLDVAAGVSDFALAVGVDKFGDGRRAANKDGLSHLSPTRQIPAVRYALIGDRYCRQYGVSPETLAQVAVKNHGNAAINPNAQFRKPRTLEQVLASARIVGDLTALQCCPRGEGAAAAIVVSEAGLKKLTSPRPVRVASSVSISEELAPPNGHAHVESVRKSTAMALGFAGKAPADLDLIELHDAFSVEELLYTEAMGLAAPGQGGAYLLDGRSAISGETAINTSGGLIGMGHPIGPTGLGQVHEIVTQIRGEAGARQHPGATTGLAHLVGLGAVAVAHVLTRI